MNQVIKTLVTAASLAMLLSACTSSKTDDAATDLAAQEAAAAQAAADAAAAAQAERDAEAKAHAESLERSACFASGKVFYFDFDQSVLGEAARTILEDQASCVKKWGGSIRLEGHADERGSREYNIALGERRANAARDFLVFQGVSESNIETVSYGEERPVVEGSYESSWSKNRRVEIK